MITSAVNVASTFPGLWLVEVWGRRPLLLFGAIGMSVCQFIVAGVGTGAGTENIAAQQALIAFVCIYIFFFACSWGPCAWVVTGEIFPLKVRAKALSMTTASNWLLNWAIAYATPYLVNDGAGSAGLHSKVFFSKSYGVLLRIRKQSLTKRVQSGVLSASSASSSSTP